MSLTQYFNRVLRELLELLSIHQHSTCPLIRNNFLCEATETLAVFYCVEWMDAGARANASATGAVQPSSRAILLDGAVSSPGRNGVCTQ